MFLLSNLNFKNDMQTRGRGRCGKSQWSAARETARRAEKLDEEGLEVIIIVCIAFIKMLKMLYFMDFS